MYKSIFSICAAILGISALHFASFIAYFSFGFSVLLDLGSTANFIFSGFFFYALFDVLVRICWLIVFDVFSQNTEHKDVLDFASKAFISGGVNGLLKFLISISIFSFFYVGWHNFILFCVFQVSFVVFLSVLVGIARIVNAAGHTRKFSWGGLLLSHYDKVYAIILSSAALLGGLRADYIASYPSHILSMPVNECGESGAIILSSSVGFYFFDTSSGKTCFVSWESGITVQARRDANNRFFLLDYINKIPDGIH